MVTLVPSALACGYSGTTSGDRAATLTDAGPGVDAGGARCPLGERCDPSTPYGLAFAGALPSPHELRPIAAGGREVVRVFLAESASLFAPGWPGPFVAGPSDGTVLAIRGVAEPDVDVSGRREGTALLRIVSPTTSALYDRVTLVVRDVARMNLTTREAFYATPGMDIGGFAAGLAGSPSPYASDPLEVLVTLEAADGTWLWDDSLRVEGHTMTAYPTCAGMGWCLEPSIVAQSTHLSATEVGAPLDLVVSRDAGTSVHHLDVVPEDGAMWLVIGGRDLDTGAPIPSVMDGDMLVASASTSIAMVCAVAMTGRGPVVGYQPLLDDGSSCVLFAPSVGTTPITATLGALHRTVSLVMLPTDDAVIAPQPLTSAPSPFVLGERAAR